MMESGKMIRDMEKDKKFMIMETNILANGKMTKNMDLEFYSILMETNLKGNSRIIQNTMENRDLLMATCTKVNGKTIKCTELEN
jgi:hypothetical protein